MDHTEQIDHAEHAYLSAFCPGCGVSPCSGACDEDLPDYDDVIAEAKRLGWDPYDATGEYRPAAVEAAMASLARTPHAGSVTLAEQLADDVAERRVAELRRAARLEDEGLACVVVSLAPAADPGCYGCQGTGRIRWAHSHGVPCSCVTTGGEG